MRRAGERPTLALTVKSMHDAGGDGRGPREAASRDEVLARGVPEEDFEVVIPRDVLEPLDAGRLAGADLDVLRAEHRAATGSENWVRCRLELAAD